MKAIFIDRDGTIVQETGSGMITSQDQFYLFEDTLEAFKKLAELDYLLFIITNDKAIAEGKLTPEKFVEINHQLLLMLAESGAKVDYTFFCPHAAGEDCDCRKPKPGLIKQAQERYPELNIAESWVIGDKLLDVGLGKAVGAQTILVNRSGKAAEGTADYVVPDLKTAAEKIASPVPGLSFGTFGS